MKRMAVLLMVLLAACTEEKKQVLPGYIEAEYTRVAAPIAGRLVQLSASKGSEIKVGAPLFVLEAESELAAVNEAKALVQRSTAQAADLAKGKRQDEIAVLEAQRTAVQASLSLAQSDLRRQGELAHAGFTSGASLEALQSKLRAEQAQLAEVAAQLKVAKLAARVDAQAAAKADVAAAQAQLIQTRWRLDQKAVVAPVGAWVDDTLYRVGEWVPAGSPVVSLQEPGAIKVRFFVPQDKLNQFRPGEKIQVRCDGCKTFSAKVSYVAKSAEFTPPVIYSKENRAKLVFMVEALPDQGQTLSPGQPVDVLLELPQ
ncbi:MAG: HlyD family efflux transporter periplasmic adaptor subunit [Formivibrio sp.]|nr:HlyD family efflux transporter periplasmic adaptor subunit [Formivibrio sp.]